MVALYEGGQKFTNRHEASGLFKLNYEIIDGLTFTGIANVKYTFKGEDSQSRKLVYKNYFTQEIIEKGQNSYSDRRDQNNYYNLQALQKFIVNSFEIRSSRSSVSSIAEDVQYIHESAFLRSIGAYKE